MAKVTCQGLGIFEGAYLTFHTSWLGLIFGKALVKIGSI